MLSKSELNFTVIFTLIVIAELFFGNVENLSQLHYISKPLIVLSLIVFFWRESASVSTAIRNLTWMALVFSLFGDVLLMFVDQSPKYFIFGLFAFLLAHLMYILVFLKHRNNRKKPVGYVITMLIYAMGLFYLLRHGLGEMLLPVLIYMAVILTMSIVAFLRKGKVSETSYHFVFLGSILFMVSDSILALNKFYRELQFAHILIMLTYAFAQYFIIIGIKKAP